MRQLFPVSGRVAALMASALLGGGLAAGCSQGESPAPGGQAASSPQAATSPAGPTAAASPAAPAADESPAGATTEASPGAGGGTQVAAAPAGGGGGGGDVQRGQQLFAQNCATCHGASGHGDGPAAAALNPKPQDLTDDEWKHGGSPDQIFQTITNGVPGTAMVSWASLPEADRHALVAYILSLKGK
ncbi:MAG TPA: c-type cytochrome [Thermodesulfobacteriota bacterium]